MIPQIIQSTAVSGLVLSMVALVLAWLFGFDIRPMHVLARVFCRLPVPLRVLVMVLLVHVFVFASTKHDDPPPLTAPRPQQRTDLPRDAFGFTAAQFEAGFVYAGCATNEHWSFEAPEGAEEVADWRKRGAAYDWRRLVCTGMSTVVFSDGWLKSSVRDAANVFAPFGAPLGIVPEGGWPNLPSEAVPSRFWYGQGECGSRIYTWQNALLGRDTNASVSVQAEFFENGDFAYRYDLSQAGDLLSDPAFATNVVIGAWNAGHGETVPASNLTARLTSVLFRHLERRDVLSGDRDGDGLMTYDEIFSYHTDPDFVDTDGDGIPDGAEVAEGLDPLVRDFSDAEILLRVASSSTNEACLAEDKVLTNSLSAWKLWDGFAAFVPSGATNLVFERTFVLDRAEGWRQFYLSAKPDSAAGWTLQGLDLIWTDSAGTGGCVTRSPLGDSLYLPLPTNESSSVTIRLVATGGFVRSPGPVYLLAYDPKILIRGGSDVELDDGVLASVFTKGSESEIALTVDRADRPCRAAYHPDELTMPGIADMSDRSGGAFAYEGDEASGMVVARGTGILDLPPVGQRKRIVVLNPSVGYEEEHDYVSRGLAFDENGKTYSPVYSYPIDGRCLWRNWNRTSGGARVCSCTPKASTGLGHEPDYVRMETLTDGENFHAEIRVGGLSVWSGDARHWRDWSAGSATESGSDLLTSLDECETCDVTCAGGVCDTFEGADIGSLEFRIPLGIPRKGQVSGFVHFRTETAVSVSPDIFDCTCRDDADVSVVTNGLSRRFVCGDRRGRDILIEPISDGVRITVRTASSQELEHVWEIVNVEGDSSVVRLRKISRLDNVMEDLTYVCDAGDWSETDNITGIRTEFFGSDGLNDPDDGLLSECRVTYDSTGRMVGDEFVNYARIGEGENAVLRETYYSSWNGGATVSRIADYWSDSHLARHGKLRLMSGNDRPWEYHDWDDFGRETLCVEQRNGSAVPLAFPTVISNALRNVSGLNDAFVTVYSYDPLVGDAEADVDFGCVRRMTRYVVRDGTATIIGCEWHRFTHLVRNGYPAVKNERIRGAASSYVIKFDEDAAGVPLLLRGEIAEELDENGIRTENTYDVNGLTVTKTSRKFRGTAEFPIYEVSVLDAVYGNILRSSVRMTADGALIGDEQSAYDDQNRLRSRSYLDGTSSTNAYSCCRLLWSRDREGRTTLRSAVTGQDRLYFADEETWMLEVVSNGYKVTQHFVDGFGRETNTVTFVGTVPGEANDWRVSEGRRIAETRFDYPWGGDGCEIALDSRGRRTTRTIRQYQDRDETVEVVSAEGLAQEMELTTTQTDYRNGRHETRRDWGGKWTVEAQETDYDAGGCEVSVETVRGSDCGCVTNSVTRHDMLGRVISVATPSGTTEYAYDGNSSRKISSVTTVDGFVRTTGYVYDAFGQAVGTVRDGLSVLHETGYERISNVWWRVARETVVGTVTNSVSETRERLTGLSDALRAQTVSVSPEGVVTDVRTSYDPATDLVTETTLSSVSSPFIRRLRHGKVIEMSSAEGMTSYAYDALGREVERCQDGRRTVVAYSAADDIASVTVFTNGIAGVTESYGYDHCGRRVSVTNALGEVTMTSYDGRDNVVAEEGVNGPVRFGYDARGRRISLSTTRNGTLFDVTEWTYDPVNASPTSKTYSDGSRTEVTLASDGLPLVTTLPSGKWTGCVYDAWRRRTGTVSSDARGESSFAYDDFGRQTFASNLVARTVSFFGAGDVVTNECVTIGERSFSIVRQTDRFGRLGARGVSGCEIETIGYSAENRIGSVSNSLFAVEYVYGADGSDLGWTLSFANGATLVRQVVRDAFRPELVSEVRNLVNGAPVANFVYGRDALGRVTSRNGEDVAYDGFGRVVGASGGSYAYDCIGNFTRTVSAGETNVYTTTQLNQYSALDYSVDGELLGLGGRRFAYDSFSRLSSVSTGGVTVASYDFDAFGRRVRKTTGDTVITFVHDGWNLVLEHIDRGSGTVDTIEYFWGKDASGTLGGAGGVGGLLALAVNGVPYAPLYDANGNVVAYVNAAGTVVAEYAYDAFGRTVTSSGALADLFRFRFSTKYTDPESGLIDFGFRFYAPEIGRWLTRDPLEEEGGLNLYAYCVNDGMNGLDPLGLSEHSWAFLSARDFWRGEVESYFRRNSRPWSAYFLDHSLQDAPDDLEFYMAHAFTGVVINSKDYLDFMKDVVRRQGRGYRAYKGVSGSIDFASVDLDTSIGRANVRYSGTICKRTPWDVDVDLQVEISDDYDFHFRWFSPFVGNGFRLLVGNTLARMDQATGVIVPYSISVNFTENRRDWR